MATYTDGSTLYVLQSGPEIMIVGTDGTRLMVGDWFGTRTGTISDQSYTDTSQSPSVTYEVLSFSGALVSQGNFVRSYTGSGTVAYAYTRTCKSSRGADCTTHFLIPMAVKYTY